MNADDYNPLELPNLPLPPGVKSVKDNSKRMSLDKPMWLMAYEPSRDGTPADDVHAIVDGFLRPYSERHCSHDITGLDCRDEIALVRTRMDKGERIQECPVVTLMRGGQLWDMLRDELLEFFEYFCDHKFQCEVRFDTMFGGPMLTLEDESGLAEMFMVCTPDRYGVK